MDIEWIHFDWLDKITDALYLWVLVPALLGAGIFFTVRMRFAKFRLFGESVRRSFGGDTSAEEGGISSFQAFAVGLVQRVGTGTIAGVVRVRAVETCWRRPIAKSVSLHSSVT